MLGTYTGAGFLVSQIRNVYFLNIIFNSVEEGQGHSTAEILIKQIVISQAVVKLTVLYACLR